MYAQTSVITTITFFLLGRFGEIGQWGTHVYKCANNNVLEKKQLTCPGPRPGREPSRSSVTDLNISHGLATSLASPGLPTSRRDSDPASTLRVFPPFHLQTAEPPAHWKLEQLSPSPLPGPPWPPLSSPEPQSAELAPRRT